MPKSNKLKPCPWCGVTPKVCASDVGRDGLYEIYCANLKCEVVCSIVQHDSEASQKKTNRLWNTRRKPRGGKHGK